MKRFLSTLLIVAMLFTSLLTLASCNLGGGGGGGANNADFVVPEEGYDGSAVTIKFYHTMGADLRKVLDDAIADFNKLYPKITIEHEQVGSYDDVRNRIKQEISVGDQPHIAYCYPDHVALYNLAKATIKLDNLIASEITVTRDDGTTETLGLTDEQIADFIPGYYAEGAQYGDDAMYTLPLSKSTEVLFYNKTFFAEHNIPFPDENTTWDDLEDIMETIKSIDEECIPLGYDSEANWFITMTEQLGSDYTSATGEHFVFDNDANYQFMERFRGWYQDGLVTTQGLNNNNYSSKMFVAKTGQKCYMSIGSSAGAKNQRPGTHMEMVEDANGNQVETEVYDFEVGCTIIPQTTPSEPKVISQGPSLCIFGKSNAQEVVASWLFVKFITTDVKFQARFSMASGYVPVIQSVNQNKTYADFLAKADGGAYLTALSAKQCLDQAKAYYTSPAFNGSSTARDQVGLLLNACLSQTPLAGESELDMIKRLFANTIRECEDLHPN